ncbi:ArdC family protein [Enterovibrio sp. NIFS-20-8]|nr:ArdC family protein [Enterovibrio paralichthyis]MBV7300209.1 ArdC family protein [Enterovibrio paralichthyis]
MENFNAVTNNFFSSNNQELLDEHKQMFGLDDDRWAGFRQWQQLGRKVKKGAKA